MNTQQSIHYSKAPIVEAIIDLRIKSPEDFTFEKLGDIKKNLPAEYSMSEIMSNLGVKVKVEKNKTPHTKTDSQNIGYKFTRADKKFILQARLDGFTLSALPPYDCWDAFRDEASKLWPLYLSILSANSVIRAAVRYINRIDIPSDLPIELKDYLKTYLEVSSEYKYDLQTGFFGQVKLPQPDLKGMLILNEAGAQLPKPGFESIILDIDLFSERRENPWKTNNSSVWDFLEKLHDRKNEIFESSITEKTKELIR